MRNTAILIFPILFSALVIARSWCAFQGAEANAAECGRIVAGLENAKANEGDIIEALLSFTKNSASNKSSILATEPIRTDHAKSMKLIDEQIKTARERAEKGWRTLAVDIFLDAASLSALILIIGSTVLFAGKKQPSAFRRPAWKKRSEGRE